jgi:hypothetical protein
MTKKTDSGFEYPDEDEYSGMVFEQEGELTVNLADVKELKFENIPRGTYSAEVDSAEFGMSQNSGSPMIKLVFKITDGEYAGRKLPSFLSFSAKALPGTKATILRLAPELAEQAFKPQKLCDEGYFTNKPCRIRIDLGEYNGEKRSQIRGVMPAAAGGEGAFFQQGNAA